MRKVGRLADKFIAYLGYMGSALGAVSLIVMMLLITANVILRYLFNKPLLFGDEYAAYLFLIMAYMGLAYAARADMHIRVDLVVRRLSKRVRDGLDVVTSLAAIVLVGVYFWFDWGLFVGEGIIAGRKAPTPMETPLWIPLMFLWLGLLFVGLELVSHIVKKLIDFQKKSKGQAG